MRIINVKPSPFEESIIPCIEFQVEIGRIKFQEAIIGVSGLLKTDDGKTVATLHEKPLNQSQTKKEEVGVRGSFRDNQIKEESFETVIIAPLERKSLEHIEVRRMSDRKNDVNLTLCLNVKYIQNKSQISPSFLVDPQDGLRNVKVQTSKGLQPAKIMVYANDSEFSSEFTNRWIISAQGGPVFLEINEARYNTNVRIPSTDWIHDYAPKLELGEYFIVQIPKGKKTIKKAWEYIVNAEESYRTWNTKGVFGNCRELGVLLDKNMKKKFGKDNYNYIERWGRVYQRFNKMASLDLHLEDIEKSPQYKSEEIMTWKADTEHILFASKLLLKYAEELI